MVTLTPEQQAEIERTRLTHLSDLSTEADVLFVEVVYQGRWARFDISTLELQHLSAAVLWERHLAPALFAVGVPEPVCANAPSVES